MKEYLIVSPKKIKTSAGVQCLYRLCEDLKSMGCKAKNVFPRWNERANEDQIVVYPDCFPGNSFKGKNVVRYLLNYAGFFGQEIGIGDADYMYYHSPEFLFQSRYAGNILSVPMIDEKRFPYKKEDRSGSCYLAIKYHDHFGNKPKDLPPGCIRITPYTNLEELFKTSKKLITYDNSAINLEAEISGMEVEYRLNETFPKRSSFGDWFDYNSPRESFLKLKKKYSEEQLSEFIKRTQEHFK